MNVNYFKQFWKSSLMVIMLCFGLTSWGQETIAFNGAETTGTTLTTSSNDFTASNTNSGTPNNERRKSGSQSFQQQSTGTKTLITNGVSLSGHTSNFVEIWNAMVSTSTGNGIDSSVDKMEVYVSETPTFSGTPDVTINSSAANVRWGMSGTGVITTTAGTPVTKTYNTGGTITGVNAFSKIVINIPNTWANVFIKVVTVNNADAEVWCIDDIAIKGIPAPSCTTPTYSFESGTVNKIVIDEPFTNEFISHNTSAFVWSSTDTGVATVDGNGEVTIVGAGTTEIRVNQAADDTYCAVVDASYILNVAAVTYAITATSNNETFGTVLLSGNIITATPGSGYTYATPAYTVTEGSATVDQNGNEFTVTPSSDATVQINFEAMPLYTLSLVNDGSAYAEGSFPYTTYEGDSIELPTLADCGSYTFAGWDANSSTTSTPTYAGGATYTTTGANVTLYAVYSETVGAPETWERVTTLNDIVSGTYVILNGDFFLPNTNTGSSSAPSQVTITSKGVAINDNTLTGTIDSDMQWNFTGTNTAMSIVSAANALDNLYNTSSNNGVRVHTTTGTWAFETYSTGFAMKNNDRYCAVYTSGSDWRSYTSRDAGNYGTNNGVLDIYKKSGGSTTVYTTAPGCDAPLLSVSETELTAFNYVANNGPSVSQSFTVNGVNLDGSTITVTAPASFEVSTDGATFAGSLNLSSTEGTLAATTVYVRLMAGLTADNYSGNITISGGTAPEVTVAVSGEVTPVCDEGTLTAGTAETSATEVTSGGSVYLSLTGTSTGAGLSYQWQSSSNGTDWSDIDGATNATYDATNITAATYFRAEVTCGITTVASNSVHVTLLYCEAGAVDAGYEKIANFTFLDINNPSSSTAGYENFTGISTDASTSTHPFSVTISEVDDSDQILIWIDLNQNAIFENNELVYEGDILDGSNDTVTGNITIPNTATLGSTRLRIRLHYSSLEGNSNPCGNSTYGQVEDYTVNILPDAIVWTTANEWSNVDGPTITDDAIIEGDLTLTGNLSAKTLTVAAGGKITVPANTSLTVEGKITNNGEFTVESDGILYQNNYTGANEGNITVERAANPMRRLDYTLWSSPVSGMLLNQFSNISNNGGTGTIWNRVYELGATAWTSIWGSYAEASTSTATFADAKGYLYRAFNSYDAVNTTIFTGEFTGVPNNGTKSISTPNAFDAVGNPYPSPIYADDFITSNNANAIYFWTNVNSSNGTEYVHNNWASYTLAGGVGVAIGGDSENIDPDTIPADDMHIQPGQGFVVYTVENSVSFDNSMRINSNGQFFRAMNDERSRFWLNLSNEEVTFNQILVGYMDNATQGVDTGIDGKMFAYEGNALYSIIENNADNYVIQGRSLPFTASDVVALGFRAVNTGSFTISLHNFDGLFADNQNIYLKDNFTQAVHNLKDGAYSFVSEEGVFNTRFEVVYQTAMSVENPVANNANWVVYNQENGYQIQTQGFELQNVTVFDLLGRTIYTANAQGTVHQIPALGAESVYIVKVTTTDNVVLSKKVK